MLQAGSSTWLAVPAIGHSGESVKAVEFLAIKDGVWMHFAAALPTSPLMCAGRGVVDSLPVLSMLSMGVLHPAIQRDASCSPPIASNNAGNGEPLRRAHGVARQHRSINGSAGSYQGHSFRVK